MAFYGYFELLEDMRTMAMSELKGEWWASALYVDRLMNGIEQVWDRLTEEDKKGFKRLMLHEASAKMQMDVLYNRVSWPTSPDF